MGGEGKEKGRKGKGSEGKTGERIKERGRGEGKERKGGEDLAYSRRFGPRKT